MPSDALRLTAQIVMAHASIRKLTTQELVITIKALFHAFTSMEGAVVIKAPSIPLKDIVKDKYVVCLECGKKMRTLKAHLRKSHQLMPKEYFRMYGLHPKNYPLVCKEYSAERRKLAIEKGLGAVQRRKKAKA